MQRSNTIDLLKIILSFLVIFIHIDNDTFSNPLINHLFSEGISRIAVPCFFIINGYFFFEKVNDQKALLKYTKNLLFIFIFWNLVYLPYSYEGFLSDSLLYKLLLLFNGFFHLWYLSALILISILVYYLNKTFLNEKLILSFSVIFFLIGFLIQKFEIKLALDVSFEFVKWDYISRNFLTIGFPFFFIGFYIKKFKIKIKLIYLVILTLLGFSLLVMEFILNESEHFKTDFLFSTLIVSPIIFLIALHENCRIKELKINRKLNLSKLSTNIYFVHLMVIFLLPKTPILLVFLYSFTLSYLIIKIKDFIVKKSIFSNFITSK